MESQTTRSLASRYLVALLAPFVMAGVVLATWPFYQDIAVLPYLLAVIFCAWYGGLGSGLLCLVVSSLLADFFFTGPYFKKTNVAELLLFAVVGAFISVMSELMHRERRRAEINLEAFSESEERFRQIAESVQDVIWMVDSNVERLLYVNPAYERIWGASSADLYQDMRAFMEPVHPDDCEIVVRVFEEQKAGNLVSVEYRIIRPDGAIHWIRDRSFPVRNAEGEIYRIAGVAEDITASKQAEEALKATSEQLRALSVSLQSAREEERSTHRARTS